MPVIAPALFTVLKRFPERKDCIKRLFKENDSFRSLCEDYLKCAKAMRYWGKSESEEAPTRREEYGMLQQDLEAEILEHLN